MLTSIRARLTAWYVIALAASLLALGGGTFALARAGLYEWLDDTLAERAQALSEELRLVAEHPELPAPERRRNAYEGAEDGFLILDGSRRSVLARGADAEAFAGVPGLERAFAGEPIVATLAAETRHRWRVAAHPVLSGGRVAAVALAGHSLDEVEALLERIALVMLALTPLALLGAGLGGYFLAGRALSPVDAITRAAAAISERNLSQRLPDSGRDELGRLASTFNALIERLEKAFERQRRFTADASHELRTPLAIIRAASSQKLMEARPAEDYQAALRRVDEAADYMNRLVTQLLTLARADSGLVELEREPLNLAELLEHTAAQIGEASGRRIEVRASEEVVVYGDRVRLTQLLANLLENAVRYTSPDQQISLRLDRRNGAARIRVVDGGIGVPPEHLPHIFERFYRVDQARSRADGGSGLGLSIARWVAEAHGGSIAAASEPGCGTEITVTLPAGERA